MGFIENTAIRHKRSGGKWTDRNFRAHAQAERAKKSTEEKVSFMMMMMMFITVLLKIPRSDLDGVV